MARLDASLWYALGRGAALLIPPRAGRWGGKRGKPRKRKKGGHDPLAGILVGTASAFVASTVTGWARRRRPSSGRLVHGAIAGAGAAAALFALRLLRERDEPEGRESVREAVDELLAGAGRGIIYAALLDPYLPGPPIIRGALTGTADYFAAPLGGLFSRLQSLSPIRKVPVISVLLETGDAEDDPFYAFLLQGILLGILHGDSASRG